MTQRISITSYVLQEGRSRSGTFTVDGASANPTWIAVIRCEGTTRNTRWQIRVYFSDDPAVPDNALTEVSAQEMRASVFLRTEQYSWCVDLLRNESPVMLIWDDASPNRSFLTTGSELVGEGETIEVADVHRSYAPFREHSTQHSLMNGYLLAHASKGVYGEGGDATTKNDVFFDWFAERYEPLMTVDGTPPKIDLVADTNPLSFGFQAIVMSNPRFVILTIRGTQFLDDSIDAAADAVMIPVPIDWTATPAIGHSGFVHTADIVYPDVVKVLQAHLGNGRKLWITGHSLGGAMATLIALKLETLNDARVDGVATFGALAVGDAGLKAAYAAQGLHRRTRRWVNHNDFAPQLVVGASHVDSQTFIDAAGGIHPNSQMTGQPATDAIDDHTMDHYMTIIRSKLSPEQQALTPLPI